jgi:hypothetical protein
MTDHALQMKYLKWDKKNGRYDFKAMAIRERGRYGIFKIGRANWCISFRPWDAPLNDAEVIGGTTDELKAGCEKHNQRMPNDQHLTHEWYFADKLGSHGPFALQAVLGELQILIFRCCAWRPRHLACP